MRESTRHCCHKSVTHETRSAPALSPIKVQRRHAELIERLHRIESQCALALADAWRVEAAGGCHLRPGPWLARAGDMLDEMDELLMLAGTAASSAVRDRVASLRNELHRLASRASDHATP